MDAKPANAQAGEAIKEFFFGKTQVKVVDDVATDTPIEEKSNCEVFDGITVNALDLENSSSEMKLKIDKIEESVDNEAVLRAGILADSKDFILLKSKEKIIFKTMKKQIEEARVYYSEIDSEIGDTEIFINENSCDDDSLERDDVLKTNDDINNLKTEEAIFKKELVASLKEKVKILQDNVKDIKTQKK